MSVDLAAFDAEAHKILNDFVPDKVFDTHAHFYHQQFTPYHYETENFNNPPECFDWERYVQDMQIIVPGRTVHANMLPYPEKRFAVRPDLRDASDAFTVAQLDKDPLSVGSLIVAPGDTAAELEKRLVHPRIKGFKCYYLLSDQETEGRDRDAAPEAFLPEGAWELANQKGMTITLHLTRTGFLANPDNLRYIRTMAKRYPNAILILAHAGCSYASWPAVEAAQHIADLDNVWVDLSAIFVSPPAFQLINRLGVSRCMWGTDFPGPCMSRTGCVTVGRTHRWLGQKALDAMGAPFNWHLGVQTLMAIREAAIMADLTPAQIEDLFYNNAMRLFHGK